MARVGLIDRIHTAAAGIDAGRKGFATRGKAEEGRISYEKGIALAMTAFKEAQTTGDPYIMLLAEYAFLTQELEFCEKDDKASITSITRALRFFDDAFNTLKVVEDSTVYHGVEQTYPHDKDYRVGGCPRDAFHIAYGGHKTRLQNMLKTPGVDPIEKALLKQRLENLPFAQNGYLEKQRKALNIKENIEHKRA